MMHASEEKIDWLISLHAFTKLVFDETKQEK